MNLLKKLLVPAVLIANVINGNAQSIELMLSPTTQTVEIGQTANFTIKAKGIDGFNGQIFLKISSSGMPNSKNELSSDLILPPYTETSTLSITPFAGTEEKTYSFTIDAYNGTLSVSKSLIVQVKKGNCAWESTDLNISFIDNKGEYWGGELPNIFKSNDPSTKYALPNYEYRNRFIDAENNFWFATNKGIVKFDGKSATVINTSVSNLPTNDIINIALDSNKTIWVSNKTMLYKKTSTNWELMKLNIDEKSSLDDITIDGQNNVWIVVNGYYFNLVEVPAKLIKINNNIITVMDQKNSCLPHCTINKINIDKNKDLWLGLIYSTYPHTYSNQNSILKLNGKTWEFWCNKGTTPYNHYLLDSTCKVLTEDNKSNFEGAYGNEVNIDGNNNKWVKTIGIGGTSLGISKFNDQEWKNFDGTNSIINQFISRIVSTPYSKKVFVDNQGAKLVYGNCGLPLNTVSTFNLSTNTVTISHTGNNQFQIQSQQNIDALILMNMNGTELRNEIAKTNTVHADYSGYASGLYLIKVISNNQVSTKKLRIE